MHPGHDTIGQRTGGSAAAGAARAARPFGWSRRDLDVDLANADRPVVVTQVLAACLGDFDSVGDGETVLWEWTVEERLQALLAIALLTARAAPLQTRCAAQDCGATMQIDLDLANFVAPPSRDSAVCTADGRTVIVRLPRGVDQREWRDSNGDAASLATRLIESIDGRPPDGGWIIPPHWIDRIDAALAERDPLTVLEFQAACPNCGHANQIAFDLERHILQLLAGEQRQLIDDVDRLAAAYHWSETEICALPHWRRRAYLQRIERKEGR